MPTPSPLILQQLMPTIGARLSSIHIGPMSSDNTINKNHCANCKLAGVPITEFKLPDKRRYEETTKKSVLTYTKIAKKSFLKYFKLIRFRDTAKINFILPPKCLSNSTAKYIHQTETPLVNIKCSRLIAAISPKPLGLKNND